MLEDFSLPTTPAEARASALRLQLTPSTYMSAADPNVFDHQEVVVVDSSTGKQYTPADYPQLLADAGPESLRPLADSYIGLVKFTDPARFPYVDVYAENGSGIPTQIGAVLANLSTGQVVDAAHLLLAPGDINQEDLTDNAVRVWQAMPCFPFSLMTIRASTTSSCPATPTCWIAWSPTQHETRATAPDHPPSSGMTAPARLRWCLTTDEQRAASTEGQHTDGSRVVVVTPGPKGAPCKEVRSFGTVTADLLQLADWLAAAGSPHAAMESTGVYWKPLFNLLEGRFTLVLANAQHIKQVPGRKTDVRDCE